MSNPFTDPESQSLVDSNTSKSYTSDLAQKAPEGPPPKDVDLIENDTPVLSQFHEDAIQQVNILSEQFY